METDHKGSKLLPLVSTAFKPGDAKKAVEMIEDPDERQMALADYYQYTDAPEKAVSIAVPYLEHDDPALSMSAHVTCFLSGLAIGDADGARKALLDLEKCEFKNTYPVSPAYVAGMIKIMMFFKDEEVALEEDIPDGLPEGAKYHASYFLSLKEYLRDNYELAVGRAQSALDIGAKRYPIPAIYLNIICASSLARIRKQKEAETYYRAALEMALPDGFMAPFGQQYVMLAGLNKKILKKENPAAYKKVSKCADLFHPAWIDAHNYLTDWHEKNNFTKMEEIAVMLFKKGFTMQEIGTMMSISINTVKTHLRSAYQKSGKKKREDFPQNLIR